MSKGNIYYSRFYSDLAEIYWCRDLDIHSWQGGISFTIFINFLVAFMIATLIYSCSSVGCTEVSEIVSSTKSIDIAIRKDGSIFDISDVPLFRSIAIGVNRKNYIKLNSTSFKESIVTGKSMHGIKYQVKVKLYEDKVAEIGKWYFNNVEIDRVGSPWRRIRGRSGYISTHEEPDDVVLKRALANDAIDGIDSELSHLGHCEILSRRR